jgi:lipoyl(octanoyl) transferase
MPRAMRFDDLGQMPYRPGWAATAAAHAEVLAGGPERVLLVEHPPTITTGRRPDGLTHLLATPEELARRGVELVESDRGGDVTFHGPGQMVAYPILRLADHGFTVSSYVHWLERVVIDLLATLGVPAHADPAAVGVWTDNDPPAKICAIGVRIRRGVTMHGLALNVTTDLAAGFGLIIPCGLAGRPVTSLARELGEARPTLSMVKMALVGAITVALANRQGRIEAVPVR